MIILGILDKYTPSDSAKRINKNGVDLDGGDAFVDRLFFLLWRNWQLARLILNVEVEKSHVLVI